MRPLNGFDEYMEALEHAGPKLKELILDRAAHDRSVGLEELVQLGRKAYPEDV